MTKTRKRTIETGIKAIEKMINDRAGDHRRWTVRHSDVSSTFSESRDSTSTPPMSDGQSVMFGPEVALERNIFFWIGSRYLIDVLKAGIDQKRFHFQPMSFMATMIDGGHVMQYEIAKSMRYYKKPRWLPVALWLGPFEDWTEERHRGAKWQPTNR